MGRDSIHEKFTAHFVQDRKGTRSKTPGVIQYPEDVSIVLALLGALSSKKLFTTKAAKDRYVLFQ